VRPITPHRTYLTITKTRKGRPRPDLGCSAIDDDDDSIVAHQTIRFWYKKWNVIFFHLRLLWGTVYLNNKTDINLKGRKYNTEITDLESL
jgi:hypothetical protein